MGDIAKLEGLTLTCLACPSQWEATGAEGRWYYIRYRFGVLRVDRAASQEDWWDGRSETLYEQVVGGDLDGSMTTDEMLEHIGVPR